MDSVKKDLKIDDNQVIGKELGTFTPGKLRSVFDIQFFPTVYLNPVVHDLTSTQLIFTCSKSTLETLEDGVKYVQSY